MSTILFPRKGDRLRAHSVFLQALRVAAAGVGVLSGMVPSRASATSIAVSAGTWRNKATEGAYAGGSLTGIPQASSGMHRYDLIVFDTSDSTLKRIAGSENTPTIVSDFLENSQPQPPELASADQILLGIIIVNSSGIPTTNYGHYATSGVANMDIEIFDHGTAGGLLDDDHTQYHTDGRGDARYPLLSLLTTRGDLPFRGASAWSRLAKGTTKQILVQGANDPAWESRIYHLEFQISGGGSIIATGVKAYCEVPVAGTITQARMISADNTSGSIAVNIWKKAFGSTPPVAADSIDIYSISSAKYSEETGLSLAVAAGDIIVANVDSITSLKEVLLSLKVVV